ncbi:Excitatory amino acid transporter 3 [Nymphon striatum]|nr:Excitatory amino acid transporter 3 [Nymphon striatum]
MNSVEHGDYKTTPEKGNKNGNKLLTGDDDVPENQDSACKTLLKQNVLTIATFSGVVAGLILGFALRSATDWTERKVMYLNYPGELFLRMLKCLILPLIFSSLVSALGNLDLKTSGRIGIRAVLYYMGTTVIAVVLGIILVTSIHPGKGKAEDYNKKGAGKNVTTVDTLLDLVRNLFPPNIVQASFNQFQTVLEPPEMKNMAENATLPSLYTWKMNSEYSGGTNILGIVGFSIAIGIAIGSMKERGKPLLDFFNSLSEAIMMMTKWVICRDLELPFTKDPAILLIFNLSSQNITCVGALLFSLTFLHIALALLSVLLSPVGVMFLVASKIVGTQSFEEMAGKLGLYTGTVLAGLFIHGFVILPLIYFIIVRRLPFRFIANMLQALSTAFGTSSSSATLPVTIGCLEEKNKVHPLVSRFCLPIGATINMDGTALYEAVAALFIAQIENVPLNATKIIAVSITATAASIGAAGIPQAGLVTMVMVLNVVGLPADAVAYIIAVDWFL